MQTIMPYNLSSLPNAFIADWFRNVLYSERQS
jgi:hypothetical protein